MSKIVGKVKEHIGMDFDPRARRFRQQSETNTKIEMNQIILNLKQLC